MKKQTKGKPFVIKHYVIRRIPDEQKVLIQASSECGKSDFRMEVLKKSTREARSGSIVLHIFRIPNTAASKADKM